MKSLVELKRQFISSLRDEESKSASTISNYSRSLERFFAYTKIKRVSQLTEERLNDFSLHLRNQSGSGTSKKRKAMKPQTQNHHLIALRMFLKFLEREGVSVPKRESVSLQKIAPQRAEIVPLEEIVRVVSAPDTSTREGLRDRALLELLFATGVRVSELCALTRDDVDLEAREVTVRNAKGRTRTLFLSVRAVKTLRAYLNKRTDSHSALFLRYGRKEHDGGDPGIHPRAVERMLERYSLMAGTRRITPQVIRNYVRGLATQTGIN